MQIGRQSYGKDRKSEKIALHLTNGKRTSRTEAVAVHWDDAGGHQSMVSGAISTPGDRVRVAVDHTSVAVLRAHYIYNIVNHTVCLTNVP